MDAVEIFIIMNQFNLFHPELWRRLHDTLVLTDVSGLLVSYDLMLAKDIDLKKNCWIYTEPTKKETLNLR